MSILRILAALFLALACAAALILPGEQVHVVIWGLFPLGIPLLCFAAEIDEFRGRRLPVPRHVPRLLVAPLVPGDGRGLLFVLVCLATSFGTVLLARVLHDAGEPVFGDDDPTQAVGLVLFSSIYAIVTALIARTFPAPHRRFAVFGVLAAWIAGLFVVGVAMHGGREPAWALALDPDSLLAEVKANGEWTDAARPVVIGAGVVAALLLAIALPWIARGVRGARAPHSGPPGHGRA